jgi:hypothetical protein
MREIWIPELIIAFFLFFPLFQPFVKSLWPISGLIWLAPAALLITVAIFPAYGWRPECVPLAIFELFFTLISLPSMIHKTHTEEFRERPLVVMVPCCILFSLTIFTAFFFSPSAEGRLSSEVREYTVQNGDRRYFLRIHDAEPRNSAGAKPQPFIVLIPPENGSVPAVDPVCAGLRGRGFTVISYSRPGFDSPAAAQGRTYPPSPQAIRRVWLSFFSGTSAEKANKAGRFLETERREDLEFLLPHIIRNYLPRESPLFLAGYGAGGSALLYLAGSGFPGAAYADVRGIMVIESRLWSAFHPEDRRIGEIPEDSLWFAAIRIRIENWFTERKPRLLVPERIPSSPVPVLFLMSDRILGRGPDADRYRAVREALRNAEAPAVLAALEGTGPLDYTAHPVTHPIYRFIFPGLGKNSLKGGDFADCTASIMTNFAALTLGEAAAMLDTRKLDVNLHLESQSWTLPDLRYILNP